MLSLVLVVSLGTLQGSEDAAAQLKSICDTYASAASVTFELALSPLAWMSKPTEPGLKFTGGTGKVPRLVIRYEKEKPEHLSIEGAELFRFPNGALVGRLADGEWRRLEAPKLDGALVPTAPAGATPLDRLLVAAVVEPSPAARLKEVRDEIREATERPAEDGKKLEAWLNGHVPITKEEIRSAPRKPQPPGAQNNFVAAFLGPDGTVESFQLGRVVNPTAGSGGVMGYSGTITITPSALGATQVEVPPAVEALAAN